MTQPDPLDLADVYAAGRRDLDQAVAAAAADQAALDTVLADLIAAGFAGLADPYPDDDGAGLDAALAALADAFDGGGPGRL